MQKSPGAETSIILFDGVCNFCNGSVRFIINRDPQKHFKFAPLQSPAAQTLLQKHGLSLEPLDTFILIEEGKTYSRSTAALRIARQLKGLWPALYVLILVPRAIRDSLYNILARNRYKLFGRRGTCMIPSPELRDRFMT
ncbi:MAG: thiol-disulfide oxidoreductase DCC family protein [Acidobacteriia bacterium]|nr:thiol-disulfide oxidoreductase DCC family protein [Terriglobia bacterium]